MLKELTSEELSLALEHLLEPYPMEHLPLNLQELKTQEWNELENLLLMLAWERSQSPLH